MGLLNSAAIFVFASSFLSLTRPLRCEERAGAALIEAVQNDNSAAVMSLLDKGARVDATDIGGETALAWSVMRNNAAIAELLLKRGANPNAANELGVTPLYLAVSNASVPLVTLLLNHGADPNSRRADGETPLMRAAHLDQTEIMTVLIEHGANVNAAEKKFGQTALMWAAGHPRTVGILLEHGANVYAKSREWEVTATLYLPVVLSIGKGGSPWNTDGVYTTRQGGQNALHFAVQKHDLESVRLLLAAGVDVNVESADGTTPLLASLYHWDRTGMRLTGRAGTPSGGSARFAADLKIARLLLDRGAKVDVRDGSGYTPLHGAALAVALLTRLPRDRSTGAAAKVSKTTPAEAEDHLIKLRETLAMVKRLLDAGADPNRPTAHPTAGPVGDVRINPAPPGSSPFHIAADSDSLELVKVMAEKGGDPNLVRQDGHTPFSVAVLSDNVTIVRAMVAGGADLTARYNPTEWFGDSEKPGALPRSNQTIMHIAAAAGAADVIPYLFSVGVRLDETNSMSETPLELADHQEKFREVHAREVAQDRLGQTIIKRDTRTTSAIRALLER